MIMFWADEVAKKLKERKLPLEWVDDMKTPSGRIHVGALRGVVIHDLSYKSLRNIGVKTKYTYIFEDHDPMDALPVYLPKEKYEQYLGKPLFTVPSPEPGFKNYAQYYAHDFQKVFNTIGCNPEIIWMTDVYKSGRMNDVVKLCLDKTDVIRGIYEELYKKQLPHDWYPFQAYCPNCGKVSTTRVTGWDRKEVTFCCEVDRLNWTKGCGFCGKISPFSDKHHIAGKLLWKVEWPCKWKVIGVTVEGAGKDHMSRGGSHDLAKLVCQRVLNYPVPCPLAYEFFLVGGKKMSSSKGLGSASSEMLEILPPEILRFLMVKTKINQAINFDPGGDTIPKLFDDYQRAADAYFNKTDKDLERVFELSQIGEIRKPPKIRFSVLAQWVQMPNMDEEIKKEGLTEWAKYARVWVEKFASESEKFLISEDVPSGAKNLSEKQKEFLKKVSEELDKDWEAEKFQKELYEWAKEIGISSKEAFSAIYLSLIGKDHGPKAAWLILSLDKEFLVSRFKEVSSVQKVIPNLVRDLGSDRILKPFDLAQGGQVRRGNIDPEIFSIDSQLKKQFPSISIGVAVIKGVTIEKTNQELEKEKEELLKSLEGLTTEQLGQYPQVQSYRKLYKEMGIDWHSQRPSPEALLRRIALEKGLYTINTCVDAYNLIVMKNRVSIGAFDSDKIQYPTIIRLAKEGEEILLLGDSEPTQYKEKEIAYFDQKGGFNIDFNFRDAQRTAVQLETKNLYINVDGVYDITPQQVEKSLREACDLIIKYCGGKLELFGIETT